MRELKHKTKFNSGSMIRISVIVLLFLFIPCINLNSQIPSDAANKVKAVFLFNFTRFIDWPATSFSTEESPFIIGIVGNNPFGSYLQETVLGEKVGSHNIIIQHFENEKSISDCHVLYINSSDAGKIKETISLIESKSVLTVGEASSFNKLGGIIRFYTKQNKIRLQINTEAARIANLNISSKLLNVAKTN